MRRDVGAVAALLVLAVLPSCGLLRVEAPEDGVTVKQLSADLAFGAEPGKGEQEPVDSGGVSALDALFELYDLADDVAPSPMSPLRPFSATGPCPEAAPNAFPAEEATQTVKNGPPRAGTYRWKQEGTLEIPGLIPKTPVGGLSSRSLRGVTVAGTTTSYDYVIPAGLAGVETQSIEVRSDGVYLTRLQFRAGENSLDFNPFPLPLKLFTLPITTGEAISATGVDPVDRLTFTLTGRMGTRERIDACGVVLDAWKFSGTRVLQAVFPGDTRGVRSTTYEFLFAPQLGGMFVGERQVTSGVIGPFVYRFDVTANIGELTPGRPE